MSILPTLGLGLRRTLLISTPLIMSSTLLLHPRFNAPVLCDASIRQYSSPRLPQGVPKVQVNPRTVRHISLGSVLGLVAGFGVSVLSKPLAVLIGLGFLGIQFLESRGIHIIPYSYLQRRFTNTNWMGVLRRNIAFKLSFGITFTLAAFAGF
ncbi:hypothetical protein GQ43DRAFT_437260 [Delitschia confertaspora ATCC 74209]|uniref:FUN14 family protein n=1 Tax=Delitschia confertaspora ATCC 74209 TaxID=1513339 RepID=A0A9P4JVF0_9PLEO|nr:hypothetical protein GQ43DRAFT_437260 [Delitschia confertaspora ATCC 74209]